MYKRQGKDLFITYDLDLSTAMLGGEITVETMDGKVKLKVAPETQNGTKAVSYTHLTLPTSDLA